MAEDAKFHKLAQEIRRLYEAGDYSGALAMVDEKAASFPGERARTAFWQMCLLSLCGRPDNVLSLFRESLRSGLWWAESQFSDSDLDAVRDRPDFKSLVVESNKMCSEVRSQIKPDCSILVPHDIVRELPLLIALHGRNGNEESNLEHWQVASQRGWLVLSPRSTQALFQNSYCWDDPAKGTEDILPLIEEMMRTYPVDRARILIAGFSQGSGMAIYTALSGKIPMCGFISVGTWWANVVELESLAKSADKSLCGYFVTGLKDRTLERTHEIQDAIRKNAIQIAEEVHADLGHEFPTNFGQSFESALKFILEV